MVNNEDLFAQLFQKGPDTNTVQPPVSQAPTMGGQMPAPGSFKDDPQGAINYIAQMMSSKATGPQLQATPTGQPAMRVPVDQPLMALFGMKKTVPVNSPNFLDTAEKAGIMEFLPSNLPKTTDGKPFIGKEAFMAALNTAQSFGQKSRSPYYAFLGFDEDSGDAVTFDHASQKAYKGGKEVPLDQLGRMLNKTRPQMSSEQMNEVTNLLNAKTQLNTVSALFDPEATGPLQARLYQASKTMGVDLGDLRGMAAITDNKVRLRTVMGSAINDYIKAITGAQMSEPEARRIMSVMPDPNASDEAFMPALQEIVRITDMKLENRLGVLESQGTVGIDKIRNLAARGRRTPTGGSKTKTEAAPKKKSLNDIFGGK